MPSRRDRRPAPPARVGEDLGRRLRDEIRADGRSAYAIAEAAGLHESIVQRLASGERSDPKLSTAAALFAALGLRVVAGGGRRPGRAAAPARQRANPSPAPPLDDEGKGPSHR